MTHPILLALAFIATFAFLSNWATMRRERRAKQRRYAQANELINKALYEPFGVEQGEN